MSHVWWLSTVIRNRSRKKSRSKPFVIALPALQKETFETWNFRSNFFLRCLCPPSGIFCQGHERELHGLGGPHRRTAAAPRSPHLPKRWQPRWARGPQGNTWCHPGRCRDFNIYINLENILPLFRKTACFYLTFCQEM